MINNTIGIVSHDPILAHLCRRLAALRWKRGGATHFLAPRKRGRPHSTHASKFTDHWPLPPVLPPLATTTPCRRPKIGFVCLPDSALVCPKLRSAND